METQGVFECRSESGALVGDLIGGDVSAKFELILSVSNADFDFVSI